MVAQRTTDSNWLILHRPMVLLCRGRQRLGERKQRPPGTVVWTMLHDALQFGRPVRRELVEHDRMRVLCHLTSVLEPTYSEAVANVVSSELILLEVLVKPLRDSKKQLERRYWKLLAEASEVRLAPIDRTTLTEATRIRANCALKTPDAIHAATALRLGCALLVTNDPVFRRIPGLSVAVLDDYISA